MSTEGQQKAQFYDAIKLRFNKCLDVTMSCSHAAIRAHSVQNSTALSYIEEDGHVSELRLRIENDKPVCRFQRIGRNNASTFTGLCGTHDTELFKPIDTKPLNITDAEQLFLIAYRSVTRELHVVMESAIRIQTTFERQAAIGLVPKDQPSPQMIEATKAMYKSWLVWRYRFNHYDNALVKGQFNNILHSTFVVKARQPVLAASSFFPDSDIKDPKKLTRIALNIIPTAADETAVIFSYPKSQSGIARKRIAPIILKSGDEKLLALSTLMLDATENFFVRPSHLLSWPDEKRETIEKSFMTTISEAAYLKAKPEFMLF
jgi:hypothetical protein